MAEAAMEATVRLLVQLFTALTRQQNSHQWYWFSVSPKDIHMQAGDPRMQGRRDAGIEPPRLRDDPNTVATSRNKPLCLYSRSVVLSILVISLECLIER